MSSISAVNSLAWPLADTSGSSGPSSTSGTSTSSSSSAASGNQLNGNSFIQLLAAQLKAQDPLNPLDPSTFVTQLVEFNQLQQLININQTLSQPASSTSGTPAPTNPPAAAGQSSGAATNTAKV